MPKTVPTKPYDWTYTTVYTGHDISPTGSSTEFVAARPNDESHAIPIAELTRPDPILFYAEVPLFEDELHDNGSSHLLVRIVSNSTLKTYFMFLISTSLAKLYTACDADMYLHITEVYTTRR